MKKLEGAKICHKTLKMSELSPPASLDPEVFLERENSKRDQTEIAKRDQRGWRSEIKQKHCKCKACSNREARSNRNTASDKLAAMLKAYQNVGLKTVHVKLGSVEF